MDELVGASNELELAEHELVQQGFKSWVVRSWMVDRHGASSIVLSEVTARTPVLAGIDIIPDGPAVRVEAWNVDTSGSNRRWPISIATEQIEFRDLIGWIKEVLLATTGQADVEPVASVAATVMPIDSEFELIVRNLDLLPSVVVDVGGTPLSFIIDTQTRRSFANDSQLVESGLTPPAKRQDWRSMRIKSGGETLTLRTRIVGLPVSSFPPVPASSANISFISVRDWTKMPAELQGHAGILCRDFLESFQLTLSRGHVTEIRPLGPRPPKAAS